MIGLEVRMYGKQITGHAFGPQLTGKQERTNGWLISRQIRAAHLSLLSPPVALDRPNDCASILVLLSLHLCLCHLIYFTTKIKWFVDLGYMGLTWKSILASHPG
ncbi:hypothetical protein Pdw03_5583 [Penicillium digitatum]|uniref:Uncharacterized protein n=1 Tax=Penicillium digitatum TaxID=36651 RepID=A0A7T6XV36_PENDI|nr:hypothetical protein Pdw03_5583 [Penicillium digitatum]